MDQGQMCVSILKGSRSFGVLPLRTWAWAGILTGVLLCAPGSLPSSMAQEKSDEGKHASGNAKPDRSALLSLQDAFASLADEVEPAVVTIFATKAVTLPPGIEEKTDIPKGLFPRSPRRSTGTGSGVIISKDGWVLTNDHVAGGADKVTVKLHDGREFVGTVRRDFRSDLALVKINASTPFPFAHLGDSDKLKIGHWSIAIGSPYRYEGSFSVGVISSLHRRQEILDMSSPRGGRLYPNMIQTDAAINPGNSGGPLCNIQGEVIGINTAIESEGGGSVGIGFAIPINSAKFVVTQLLDKGKVHYGYLGVEPTSVTPRLASLLKVEQGALIRTDPQENSPAGKAGLKAGDVVTAIGMKLVKDELDLRTIIAQTTPGTKIDLTVVRDGSSKVFKTVVDEAQEQAPGRERPRTSGKASLGIEVQALTEKLAEKAGVSPKTQGVIIKSIDPDASAAEVDEVGEGVVILKVNDTETPSLQAFQKATANLKSGDQVRLILQFGKFKRFAVVAID